MIEPSHLIYPISSRSETILSIFNAMDYFLNVGMLAFLALVSAGALGYCKRSFAPFGTKTAFYSTVAFAAAGLTILSFAFGAHMNEYCFLGGYVFAGALCLLNLERKSIRYFTFSLIAFICAFMSVYLYSLHILATMSHTAMDGFGIAKYSFFYKDFFSAYHKGDVVWKLSYDGRTIYNQTAYERIYAFYYFMNSLGLCFWFFVYQTVLRLHGIRKIGS